MSSFEKWLFRHFEKCLYHSAHLFFSLTASYMFVMNFTCLYHFPLSSPFCPFFPGPLFTIIICPRIFMFFCVCICGPLCLVRVVCISIGGKLFTRPCTTYQWLHHWREWQQSVASSNAPLGGQNFTSHSSKTKHSGSSIIEILCVIVCLAVVCSCMQQSYYV